MQNAWSARGETPSKFFTLRVSPPAHLTTATLANRADSGVFFSGVCPLGPAYLPCSSLWGEREKDEAKEGGEKALLV
eukprot:7227246-Pyramimonas_sp.AAC.1